jgi:hypothetical protein
LIHSIFHSQCLPNQSAILTEERFVYLALTADTSAIYQIKRAQVMYNDPNSYQQSVEPTQAAGYHNPYQSSTPYTELPFQAPPPPVAKRRRKSVLTLCLFALATLVLLSITAFASYRLGFNADNHPAPRVSSHAISLPSPTPIAIIKDPNYTATEILNDFVSAGAQFSKLEYGTTVWTYSGNAYFVSVHATSSVIWQDPPQTAGSSSMGLWVYSSAPIAQSAYTQVGQDEVNPDQPVPTNLIPNEYLHGRCLLLSTTDNSKQALWKGYDQIVNQYCI